MPKPTQGSAKVSRSIQPADECTQLLNKTLDAYEKATKALTEKTAENQTNIDLRTKEENYNAELLKAVALLVSSEKRDKSFFKRLEDQLQKVLSAATDPKVLITIAGLIILARNK